MMGYRPESMNNLPDASLVLGVGRVAMESLACGTPVLSLNHAHLGPLVGVSAYDELSRNNFVALQAPPPVPDELVRVIGEFCLNRSLWNREVRMVQSRLEDEFAMQKVMDRTVAVYSSAIRNRYPSESPRPAQTSFERP